MAAIDWFNEARYGMFIHWGPYAVAGRGEWVMNRERIGKEEYTRRYVDAWQAENYDPAHWARLAVDGGMKYVILTARHHDGFALWDTATTDFNAARMGPKRDLVGPYVEAVRSAGLKVGLYMSAADWTHPDYPNAFARDWPQQWPDEDARQRFVQFYHAQTEELLRKYGPIDVLWWDGCIPSPMDGGPINRLAKQLHPDILINERNGEPFDYRCSEQSTKAKQGPWESCMTLNDNWGYHPGDDHWKDPKDVIRMLISVAGAGGNLLLNVGPAPDGSVPEGAQEIIRTAGAWLARNREWLPHSGRQPFTWNNCVMPTVRGSTIYLHMLHPPVGEELTWAEPANKVLSARLLATGEPVSFRQDGPKVTLTGWAHARDPIATTIALEVDGTPAPATRQESFWIPD